MKRTKKIAIFAGVSLAAVALASIPSTASAQPMNKETHFTFSRPVELPGDVRLAPGDYIFEIANTTGDRRVVRVSDKERNPKALLLTISNERMEPPDKPELRFMEVAEGQPAAPHVWWYQGERTGYEFVYPKAQAMRLARASGVQVAMTESRIRTEDEMKTADVTHTDVSGEPEPVASTGRSEQRAESVMARNEAASNRAELPRTATALPLVGLVGLFSLLAAAGLRRFQ
jgi:hypothetical protein